MAITERIERAIEREAPSWGVRPTTPAVRRLRGVDFAVLWGDLALGLLVLVTGALLVPALGLPQALLAIGLGTVLGCIPLALVGRAGSREGVPGMVLLRDVLGTRGSYVPTVLNVLQLVGWTAFELWAMALVASRIAGGPLGEGSFYVWLAIATVVCLLLSLGGPVLVVRRWMERFGLWVLAAAAGWITVRALATFDIAGLWSRPGDGSLPFGSAVDLVIAMPVSWIPLVADYNRFARSGVSSTAGTYLGYAVGNVWFYALGALLVLGAGSVPSPAGIADGIATLAGGTLVLVVLLVGETDEAFADIYSAAVSSQNIAPRLNQRGAIVAVAAIGAGLAAWLFGLPDEGVLTYEFFLLLIGSVFVPLFAVFLADHLVLGPRDERGGVRVTALVAWVLGFVAFHALTEVGPSGWIGAVKGLADALGLPHPLLGGAFPASVLSFGVAFAAALVLIPLGRRR
jgi:nucleobase:cation symporter-1, NCS1 family